MIVTKKSNYPIATGFSRIVENKKDNEYYYEIPTRMIISTNIYIQEWADWRRYSKVCYYLEYRSIKDKVKIYLQRKTVKYADYKIDFYYVNVDDVLNE